MEECVNQKIKSFLVEKQLSITAFAKMIGMQQVTCNRQLKGEQAVSLTLIQGFLSAFPEVSAEWLLRGEGEREKSSSVSPSPKPYEFPEEEPVMAAEEIHVRNTPDADPWRIRYEELEKRYEQLIGVLGKGGV